MTDYTAHEREAYRLGVAAAEAAASWITDGNTSQEHIARMIAWLDDGDPRADEYLPRRPDLSDEYADDLTPITLARSILGDEYDSRTDDRDEEIADAYEQGVDDTFNAECERILRAAMED